MAAHVTIINADGGIEHSEHYRPGRIDTLVDKAVRRGHTLTVSPSAPAAKATDAPVDKAEPKKATKRKN